jgi:hypothetical protein
VAAVKLGGSRQLDDEDQPRSRPVRTSGLLLIVLHDLRWPGARAGYVLVELSASSPLPQQVPRLVESFADLPETPFLLGCDA